MLSTEIDGAAIRCEAKEFSTIRRNWAQGVGRRHTSEKRISAQGGRGLDARGSRTLVSRFLSPSFPVCSVGPSERSVAVPLWAYVRPHPTTALRTKAALRWLSFSSRTLLNESSSSYPHFEWASLRQGLSFLYFFQPFIGFFNPTSIMLYKKDPPIFI